jgi:hypothetical protein
VDETVVGDVLLGAAALAGTSARALARPISAIARPALVRSRRLTEGRAPDRVVAALAHRGARARVEVERVIGEIFRAAVRQTLESVLAAVDVTDLVRRHVDLDALVRSVDVDAVVSRADLNAAVSRVDVDAVVSRADLNAAVSRVDVDAVVSRVDVEAVTSRVDLDALVSRVDLDAIVARVDPDAVAKRLDVDAVVGRVDVNAAVERLDLTGIALQVITAIDLPEILRESTGPAASEVVRGIRVEGVQADDAVSRIVDRLLRRRRADGHDGEGPR